MNKKDMRVVYGEINLSSSTRLDIYDVGGYPNVLIFKDFYDIYKRSGLASAVVDLPVYESWASSPVVKGGEEFNKDWEYLVKNCDLYSRLASLDRRQRVGRYGGLVIVAKEQEKKAGSDQLTVIGVKSILKLIPCYEDALTPAQVEQSISSESFGEPVTYNFNYRTEYVTTSETIHRSRAFVFSESADDGGIYGISALESPYNALLDAQKIRCGSAEGFMRNAKQRFTLSVNNDGAAKALNDVNKKAEFDKEVDNFQRGFDNSLVTYGMDAKALTSTIADPEPHFKIAVQEIAASSSIPATILIGQQTGRLASDEDQKQLAKMIKARREMILDTMIESFIAHMVGIGALPKPVDLSIEWSSTTEISDSEKLKNAEAMAKINQTSKSAGNDNVFEIKEIRKAAGHSGEIEEEDFGSGETLNVE